VQAVATGIKIKFLSPPGRVMAMAAEPADLADSQPFSPSDFLNLPPTPRLDLDCPALQLPDDDDDLVLPFISRMLMEEEMDGFFEVPGFFFCKYFGAHRNRRNSKNSDRFPLKI
jgi:hypothetical protein